MAFQSRQEEVLGKCNYCNEEIIQAQLGDDSPESAVIVDGVLYHKACLAEELGDENE